MLRCLLLILSTLLLASSLCAAQKQEESDPLGKEAKFDRNVRIVAEGIPISDLLARVSKSAGLILRADPTVADDKVIVFGPPRPLRAVLTDIAALYNDSWRHFTDFEGKEQYVLYRASKAIRYEDDLANSVTAKMQAQLEEQVRALDETPEQFAKRPENDRIKQNFAKDILHGRTATRLYALLGKQQKDTLFSQGYLNVSFLASGTTDQAAVQGAFKEAVAGLERENERVQQENPNVHIVIDSPDNLARYGVRFNLHHENNAGLSALVVQIIMGKASYMTMGAFDSGDQWLLPAHGDPYSKKPIAADANLPDPKDTSAAGKVEGWIEQLRALAEKSGRPVAADFFRCPALVKPLSSEEFAKEKAPVAALDALCRPSGYLWWMRSRTVLLRKRDWYQQRLYEVPDRWIRATAAKVQQHKRIPTYGDLASLLDLTRMQMAGLNNLLAGGGGTPDDADTLAGVPELLQLLGVAANPADPVYEGSLTPEIVPKIAVPQGPTAPVMRAPIASFLTARRQITTPADIARFQVCLTCYGPLPANKPEEPSPDPRGKSTVVVEWNPGPGQTPYDQRLQLYLPTEMPDDRLSKTKVEW